MLAAQIFLGKRPYGLIKMTKFNLMAWQTLQKISQRAEPTSQTI